MMPVSPVLALISEMSRSALGLKTNEFAIHGELEWEECLDLASREGLAALVYSGTRKTNEGVASFALPYLRTAYLGAILRLETCLEPGLKLVVGALRSSGIEPVLLKGAALAYTVYQEPAHRSMGDIDLLVAPSEAGDALDALIGAGLQADTARHAEHHSPPIRSTGGLMVELHHELTPRPNPYSLDEGVIRSRCVRQEIGGVEVSILGSTDALHYACLHLAFSHRYRWYPLRSLVDILAITSNPAQAVDWQLLVASSRRWRTAGAVYWPLRLSRDVLGAPIPDHVLAELVPTRVLERMFSVVLRPEQLLNIAIPPTGADAVLHDLAMDLSLYTGCSLPAQVRAAKSRLLPPPSAVGHLPPDVLKSRVKYPLHLGNPVRLARGLAAFGRLARNSHGTHE